jgi:biotin carboxyl carrier protein
VRIHEIRATSPSDGLEDFLVINEILVTEGEEVEKGTLLIIAEGAKVVFDIESSVGGVIKEVIVEQGQHVPIGKLLLTINQDLKE